MKLAKRFFVGCMMAMMICVPASADEIQLDTLLLTFGRTSLMVNVDGEANNELSGTYAPEDVVTLTAPAVTGKTFSCWTNGEGQVISYNAELSLTMYTDTVVNAVYGAASAAAKPVAEFLSVTRSSSQILLNAIATVPSGKAITSSGIRYSSAKSTLDGLKGSDGVTNEAASSSTLNWLLPLSPEDAAYYAVAYVEADGQTYYGEVKELNLSDLNYGFSAIADILNELLGLNSADKLAKVASLQGSLVTLTFAANEGSGAMAPQGFVKDAASAVRTNTFTRQHYDFAGWNTKADGSGTSYADGSSVKLTADTTFYAQWKASNYVISYDLQGGTLATQNPSSYNVESASIKLNNPTKEGYDFAGWTGTGITEASTDVIIPAGSTGDKILTANWGEALPVISPTSHTLSAYKGMPVSLAVSATGANLVWSLNGSLPSGLTFSSADYSATISGTPELGTSGSYLVTITAANTKGSASSEITINVAGDFALSGDVEVGALESTTTESCGSRTSLQTVFKNGSGQTILTANVAITTASEDFALTVGSEFAAMVSVDVSLDLADTDYESYAYSLDIAGLPEWLKVSGEVSSKDSTLKGEYHHEFRLTGTPAAESGTETLTLSATVRISEASSSGDLVCSVDKTITLTASSSGGDSGTPSNGGGGGSDPYADYDSNNAETPSDNSNETPADSGSNNAETPSDNSNETPADSGSNNAETPSDSGNETPSNSGGEVVEVPSVALQDMTDEEIAEQFSNTTELVLTGDVSNLSETIAKIETLTNVKTLDLSQVSGVTELKLGNTTLESISFAGNQSITTLELTGSQTLTTLNLAGSKVETVNVEGCSSLTTLSVAGAENLTALNVKGTQLTTLSVKDCAKLEVLEAKGSESLESVNLEGCESLQYLDVSETAITELDVQGCANLGTLYCASCRLEKLETGGCENLQDVDCRNNRLTMLDASVFVNLRSLECGNQRVQNKLLSRLMNFVDFLLGRRSFSASAEDATTESYASNVRNLRGYDAAGAEIPVEYDSATGEATFMATPSRITYDYVTGFEAVMMDVEVTASESESGDNAVNKEVEVMPSSGGCDALGSYALGFMMLLGSLLLIFDDR